MFLKSVDEAIFLSTLCKRVCAFVALWVGVAIRAEPDAMFWVEYEKSPITLGFFRYVTARLNVQVFILRRESRQRLLSEPELLRLPRQLLLRQPLPLRVPLPFSSLSLPL